MRQFENIRTIVKDIAIFQKLDEITVTRAVSRAYSTLRDDTTMDMGIKYFKFIKTAVVKISENMTVALPSDCEDVLKVGFLFDDYGRKELRYLGKRRFVQGSVKIEFPLCSCDDNTIEAVTNTTNTVTTTVGGNDALIFHNYPPQYGNWFGEMYEHKAQMYPNGVYSIDYDNNRLNIGPGSDTAIGNTLIVEYKSTKSTEEFNYIPSIAFQALRAKSLEFLSGEKYNEAQYNRVVYGKELTRIRSASQNITIDDFMQVICGGRHLRFRS